MTDSMPLSDDGLTILLFHGVIEQQTHPVRNYLGKHLEACHFEAMLRKLMEYGKPMSMDQVMACRESGEPFPPRSFAVTFDDGFENNHRIAVPILKQLGIPATFFVTTEFIIYNRMSWIDRIEHAIENSTRDDLKLPWLKTPVRIASTAGKIAALEIIRGKVKNDRKIDVEALIASVFEQANVDYCDSSDGPLDLKMSWNQVRELAQDPLFSVGGHGHTHAILSFLDDDQLVSELECSLGAFREHHVTICDFAYPEGQSHCYSNAVCDALKQRGIRSALTAIPGVNTSVTNPFELHRVMPTPHSLSWLNAGAPACVE